MKRFIFLLAGVGVALLLVAAAIKVSGFDITRLEKVMTSDGSFDDTALHAFKGMVPGLSLAALSLLLLAALFYLVEKDRIPLLTCRTRTFLAIVLGLQFLLGFLYISVTTYVPTVDTEWYLSQAKHLAEGTPVVDLAGKPTAYWPIGYSMLLSVLFRVFGSQMYVAQFLNVLLICAVTLFAYLTATRLHNQDTARRTALIMGIFPSQIFSTFLPMSDILFSLLVLVLLYLTIQRASLRNTLLIGLVLGMATLTRPVILPFSVVILVYRLMRDRRWKPALAQFALICVLCEAVLIPWQIRNYRVFNSFVLVSNNGGVHLWMGNNPAASGGFIGDNAFIPYTIRGWMDQNLNEAQQASYCSQQGLDFIRHNPVKAVMLWPRKIIYLFMKDSRCLTYGFFMNWRTVPSTLYMGMIALTEGFYYSLGLAFLIALVMFLRRERITPRSWLLVGTGAFFIGIYLPFIAEGRYHMPLLPLFAFLAAYDIAKPRILPAAVEKQPAPEIVSGAVPAELEPKAAAAALPEDLVSP